MKVRALSQWALDIAKCSMLRRSPSRDCGMLDEAKGDDLTTINFIASHMRKRGFGASLNTLDYCIGGDAWL